jgi:hypothetical protein
MKENGTSGGAQPIEKNPWAKGGEESIWWGKKRDPRTTEHTQKIIEATIKNHGGEYPTYERDQAHKDFMGKQVAAAHASKKWTVYTCSKCGVQCSGPGGEANFKRWHNDQIDCVSKRIDKESRPPPKKRGPPRIKKPPEAQFRFAGWGTTPDGERKTWMGTSKQRLYKIRCWGWTDITVITLPEIMTRDQARAYVSNH